MCFSLYDLPEEIRLLYIPLNSKEPPDISALANQTLRSVTLIRCLCGLESKTCINENQTWPNVFKGFVSGVNNSSLPFLSWDVTLHRKRWVKKKQKKWVALFWQTLKVTQANRMLNILQYFLMLSFLNPGTLRNSWHNQWVKKWSIIYNKWL